jgi:hypothetical protein
MIGLVCFMIVWVLGCFFVEKFMSKVPVVYIMLAGILVYDFSKFVQEFMERTF